jgi:hypothetical protein
MDQASNWVEALNISSENLKDWSAQAPAGVPLLVWCLEQGFVSTQDYLAWASAHYNLPILDSAFFEQAMDRSLVGVARAEGTWSAWLYPVSKWEDVTLVACVEPPHEEISPLVRYVLADPQAMREVWGATSSSIEIPSKPGDAPLEPWDQPQGLSDEPIPFKLSIDEATVIFKTDNAPAPAPTPTLDAVPENTSEVAPLTTLSLPEDAPPGMDEDLAPPPPQKAPPPPAPLKQKEAVPLFKPKAVGKPKRPAQDLDTVLNGIFEKTLSKYKCALVMKIEGDTAKLFRWSAGLTVSKDGEKSDVNLNFPTFLRIVTKTALPYHGYLIESPAHQEYFESLGFEKLPGCVTALPIRHNDKVWGILVGIGEEETQKIESLTFMQDQVDYLSESVGDGFSTAS